MLPSSNRQPHAMCGTPKSRANLPFHLAALARKVVAVEFPVAPPRGNEYTLAQMDMAGARLVEYRVTRL